MKGTATIHSGQSWREGDYEHVDSLKSTTIIFQTMRRQSPLRKTASQCSQKSSEPLGREVSLTLLFVLIMDVTSPSGRISTRISSKLINTENGVEMKADLVVA